MAARAYPSTAVGRSVFARISINVSSAPSSSGAAAIRRALASSSSGIDRSLLIEFLRLFAASTLVQFTVTLIAVEPISRRFNMIASAMTALTERVATRHRDDLRTPSHDFLHSQQA